MLKVCGRVVFSSCKCAAIMSCWKFSRLCIGFNMVEVRGGRDILTLGWS